MTPSPNHDARPAGATVDALVLHYTGMTSAATALARLCDPAVKVSAHYLIDEVGTITPLVPEERRAWHAGVSMWQGREGLNADSIGIELVNPGHEWGYRPFPRPQIDACIALCRTLLARHAVPPRRVLAHADVAPRRKEDPGELFPWRTLAAAGIGLWPRALPPATLTVEEVRVGLMAFGYPTDDLAATLIAFQRRFRPERVDGFPDAVTCARLRGLLAQL